MTDRDDQKRQVQQATDLVRLIGEQLALKPRGKEFLGLCPFHDDKSPSMYVSPTKQIYKCFACGAGGDAFSFVMQYHKMTFPEALKYLADRAGIKLEQGRGPRAQGQGEEGPTERQRLADANAKALTFFRTILRHPEHGKVGREYVEKRRLNPEMVEAFQIGYAPDRWDGLATVIADKRWDTQAFVQAGLITPRNRDQNVSPQPSTLKPSGCYDRFRHRLIFPICDSLGRPIAFGGRKIRSEDEPKYLNSPETPLFNKSATLYGLHLAKQAIINSRTAVIVEGYTDVIACHQAGFRNVVATLGTALTPQHVTELRRYVDKVVLIFDADEAGQKAADRALEIFLNESLDVCVAVPPGGKDPDELFQKPEGKELWTRTVAEATDALAFQFQRIKRRLDATSTITARQTIIEEYLRSLAQAGLENAGVIRRAMVLQRLSEVLHLGEQVIGDLLKRLAPAPNRVIPASSSPTSGSTSSAQAIENTSISESKRRALQQAELQVIGCLVRQPALFHTTLSTGQSLDEALTATDLISGPAALLYDRVYARLSESNNLTLADLLADLAAQGQQSLADLATAADAEVDRCQTSESQWLQRTLTAAAEAILRHRQEQQYQQLRQAVADGTGPGGGGSGASGAENSGPSETSGGSGGNQAALLRRIAEHQRANASPLRIARPKT